jgi:hypothetical protein
MPAGKLFQYFMALFTKGYLNDSFTTHERVFF